ncbi:MAG: DUF3187 family protein [Pseudomonadota bacterium]
MLLTFVGMGMGQPGMADSAPLIVENQNPFISVHGLARDMGATITPEGKVALSTAYSVASNFDLSEPGAEQITIDGESSRASLRLMWGVTSNWEVGAEIPFVQHDGGYLDDLIIDWHDWFNLPQNGRDDAPRDQLLYAYTGPQGSVVLNNGASGLGDIQLFAARALQSSENASTVLRAHIKLPTGDEDEFLGSGSMDAGISLHHERKLNSWLGVGGWIGASYLGDSDVLPGLSREIVGQGGVRSYVILNDVVTLKVQWDIHSQVYDETRLLQLNEIAYLLSFGGTLTFNDAHALDIVVVENFPHPEISPDVAFQLNWRWTP